MEEKPDTPPPLDYSTPSQPRSFEEALTDFVQQEMAAGRMPTVSRRQRAIAFIVLGLAVLAVIVAVALLATRAR
jgi:hypothetical protein